MHSAIIVKGKNRKKLNATMPDIKEMAKLIIILIIYLFIIL
ncbi:MAG: hypothetical protein AABZ36_06275 [Nitrospirota bacterium]